VNEPGSITNVIVANYELKKVMFSSARLQSDSNTALHYTIIVLLYGDV